MTQSTGWRPSGRSDPEAARRVPAMESRERLLALLARAEEPVPAERLATETGFAVTTVRNQLAALRAAGLVRAERAPGQGRGRPRLLHALAPAAAHDTPATSPALATPPTPDAPPDLAAERLRGLTAALIEAVGGDSDRARRAGTAWGRRLAAAGDDNGKGKGIDDAFALITAHAARMGFAPHPVAADPPEQDGPQRLLLTHCPYRELAAANPLVVCTLHQGVLDGLLDGAAVRAVIRPFASPPACEAELRPTTARATA
ncbi:HTH domain-containing protein [Streptomyces sp. NPDC097619]|uniref:helix-turn-helix transcriptional regulator n=1 Tax=Streptomyces sp. NPDC097619 TaxID=3157228 RepID=UPI00331A04E1